jgi:TolB-like protein/DNA-binding winged helix-turn-helix (wHTH) protein
MPSLIINLYEFGEFQLDAQKRLLRRGTETVSLTPKAFDVLLLLIQHSGEVVTKDEIMGAVWPDSFVEESNLTQTVFMLRKALGEAADQRYILTVQGRGYKFVVEVKEVPGNGHAASGVPEPVLADVRSSAGARESQGENKAFDLTSRVRFSRLFTVTAALVIVAVILTAVVLWRETSKPAAVSSLPATQIRSLAVLPLKDLSGDAEQAYFAEGMTDELITRLAAIENLRVISHTSVMRYADTKKSLPEIASELHVDALIEGTILHAREHVRINAQLVRGADDRHIWAASYERDLRNVLDLQDEIARDVAYNISRQLSPVGAARLTAQRSVQPEALQHYLRGRYSWATRRPEELRKAILEFQKAIEADPQFAPAYAGLADCYVVLPLIVSEPTAERYAGADDAAKKALALDPNLAEVHTSVAYAKLYQDWDFEGAERQFQQALRLDDNYSTAHQWYAELLALEGRKEDAIAQIQKAEELDPFSAVVHHQAGQVYRQARQYPQAIAEYKNSLSLNPQMHANYWWMADVYLHEGNVHEWAEAWKTVEGGPQVSKRAADYELAYQRDGMKGWNKKRISELQGYPRQLYFIALRYASLGDEAQAFAYLDQAYAAREPEVLTIRVDPEWDGLRDDPRFSAMVRKIGSPRDNSQ